MNLNLKGVIKDLPDFLQPFAELWLPVISTWSQEEIGSWLSDIMFNWQEGYYRIVTKMDTETRKLEHARLNEAIEQGNNDWSAFVQSQREMILAIIAGLLSKVIRA